MGAEKRSVENTDGGPTWKKPKMNRSFEDRNGGFGGRGGNRGFGGRGGGRGFGGRGGGRGFGGRGRGGFRGGRGGRTDDSGFRERREFDRNKIVLMLQNGTMDEEMKEIVSECKSITEMKAYYIECGDKGEAIDTMKKLKDATYGKNLGSNIFLYDLFVKRDENSMDSKNTNHTAFGKDKSAKNMKNFDEDEDENTQENDDDDDDDEEDEEKTNENKKVKTAAAKKEDDDDDDSDEDEDDDSDDEEETTVKPKTKTVTKAKPVAVKKDDEEEDDDDDDEEDDDDDDEEEEEDDEDDDDDDDE